MRFTYKPNAFLMISVTLCDSGGHFGQFLGSGKIFTGFLARKNTFQMFSEFFEKGSLGRFKALPADPP